MSVDVDVLEAVRLASLRAELLERHGLSRWGDLFHMPAHRYYPAVGQEYDIAFADGSGVDVLAITREWVADEHGTYYGIKLESGAGMGVAASEIVRLLGDNSARLRA